MPKVVIVGAGPAGLAAAATLSRLGVEPTIIDENAHVGGQIWRAAAGTLHPSADALLGGLPAISSAVFDAPSSGELRVEGLGTVHYDRLLLATGARELILPFPGWTSPGVFGVGGLQAMMKGGLNVDGKRVVLAGTGPLLLAVGQALIQAVADLRCIAESTSRARSLAFALRSGKLRQALGYRQAAAKLRFGVRVEAFERGHAILSDGTREPCDLLGTSYGLVPNSELARLIGCECDAGGFVRVDECCRTSVEGVWCCGEPTGIGGETKAIAEGEAAAYAALGKPIPNLVLRRVEAGRELAIRLKRCFPVPEWSCAEETLVCRCEDVSLGELKAARTQREAKLATRCGMGACQGRVCGPIARHLLGFELNRPQSPLVPVRLAEMAPDR